MKGVIEYLIKNPIWSKAFIVLTIVIGVFSYLGLRKSFFPEIDSRVVNVQVFMPGASPQEMEEGVTLKVEEAVESIQGIEKVTSTSVENFATVNVEIRRGFDMDEALSDVKNAVDGINSFPVDAEKPTIFVRKSKQTAIVLVLSGDVNLESLKEYSDIVEDDLLESELISQVSIYGIPSKEISIEVSEETLLRYGITFDQIVAAVKVNNRDISGGTIKSETEEFLIRSNAKTNNPARIENIVVRSGIDGSMLRLGEIATVREQFSEDPNYSLFNGRNAATISVEKLVNEDMVKITDHVKEYVETFNATHENLSLYVSRDSSIPLNQRIEMLYKNGSIGLILVVLALGFFMSVRLSFWVAVGIPLSFLGMMFFVANYGVTINMISLFGMILVIGILVDDGIVIAENIYTHFERGKSRAQAAVDGALEVFPAVFVSVTTTMLVFSAIFFFEDRLGDFLLEMAVVVIASLGFSLIEATLVLPSHLAHSKALVRKDRRSKFREVVDGIIDFMRYKLYGTVLRFSVDYRFISVASVIVFIYFVLGLMGGGFIQRTQFPPIGSDDINIELVLTPGTNENATVAILKEIEEKVWEVNDSMSKLRNDGNEIVLSTKINIGQISNENGSHTGTLQVELLDGETRNLAEYMISSEIKKRIPENIPGVQKLTTGGRGFFGKPIAINLTSKDFDELKKAKDFLKNELAKLESVKDITDNDIIGRKEISIQLTPKAYALGLDHGTISRQIRQGFFGEEIQRLQKGTDELKIWVRYPNEDRKTLGDLENMKIKTVAGQTYPLSELIEYSMERGIVNINHYNGAREITIEADQKDKAEALDPIIEYIDKRILPELSAQFPTVKYKYGGQFEQGSRLVASIQKIAPVIIIMILILLTLTFGSFSQALMIVLLIFVGIYCAVLGHGVESILSVWRGSIPKPISNLSFYGIIALAGIIVNDAVVFLQKYNTNVKEGMTVYDASYEAGIARFRAIMLTSVTTIFGLYPLILEKSIQAQFLIPMAISVAYGVLFGTAIILINFPAFILVVNDVRRVWKFFKMLLFKGVYYWPSREEVEPQVRIQIKHLVNGHLDTTSREALLEKYNVVHKSGLNVLSTFSAAKPWVLSETNIQLVTEKKETTDQSVDQKDD